MIKLTLEEWEEQFLPIFNNNDPEHGLKDFHPKVVDEIDMEILKKACKEYRVWTLTETEVGLFIIEGLHLLNRIDVYITEKPYNKDEDYEIEYFLNSEMDDEDE